MIDPTALYLASHTVVRHEVKTDHDIDKGLDRDKGIIEKIPN